MKTTASGIILDIKEYEKEFLDGLMAKYCSAVRFSYKRLLEENKLQDVRKTVQAKFNLNSRQANDAVHDAKATITSQNELVKLYHKNAKTKVEKIEKNLNKAKSQKKKDNLTRKLDKRQRKLAKWEKQLKEGTHPPVVFGSRELFYRRCKGLISRQEWHDARNNRYLSRGDKTKGGNLNTRIFVKGDNIYLSIVTEPVKTEKSVRYKRIDVPIYIAHKPSKKTGKINGINYKKLILDYIKTGGAYQVEIVRKNDKYYIHITIEEEVPESYKAVNALGVDTNPDGIALTQTDYFGNFKCSKWLSQSDWNYTRSNKTKNLIGETAKEVVEKAKQESSTLVVENLKFKDDRDVSSKFNRISHSFVWSTFLEMVERRAAREKVPIVKVKPAFTSIIGILKYQHQYGLSNHNAAAYVIARRGLGIKNERVPKILQNNFIKKKKGFSKLSNWKQWSCTKKSILKSLKERQVKTLVSYQHYRKELLGI